MGIVDIIGLLIQTIEVYKYFLIARILLTWLPNINWYSQPFRFLLSVTDPVMEPFRRLVPPIGMIDISPMALFLALQLLQMLLGMLARIFMGSGIG